VKTITGKMDISNTRTGTRVGTKYQRPT